MSPFRRLLALEDFEVWRPRLTGLLILTSPQVGGSPRSARRPISLLVSRRVDGWA